MFLVRKPRKFPLRLVTGYFGIHNSNEHTSKNAMTSTLKKTPLVVCRWSAEGEPVRAVALMKRLQAHGFEPSLYTYETIVWGFAQVRTVVGGQVSGVHQLR